MTDLPSFTFRARLKFRRSRSGSRIRKNSMPSNDFQALTEREQEILKDLRDGKSYKEIAAERFISTDTVRSHVRKIYEKLQVHSRTDAVNKVFRK